MEILGVLLIYVLYRAVTSEKRSIKRQRKVAERYAKESEATWKNDEEDKSD
tara:strand:- start:662 stop:814 length:153 start_codon:yes stop_codon:yes gene_type:complete